MALLLWTGVFVFLLVWVCPMWRVGRHHHGFQLKFLSRSVPSRPGEACTESVSSLWRVVGVSVSSQGMAWT